MEFGEGESPPTEFGYVFNYPSTGGRSEIIPHDQSDIALKAEMFSHYTYAKSQSQLMVLDVQGAGYSLCDPEIASSQLVDDEENILFCNGNLSSQAIDTFDAQHVCNKFCKLLLLHEK